MDSVPQVTIVMPVYNGEAYLEEAIGSVLRQTYADFALWVVNDGCTDRSMDIVGRFADPRLVRLDNPRNLGLVATLNNTFARVQSPYIARMDADDVWLPDKLERQMAALAAHPEAGICGTSVEKFGDLHSVVRFPSAEALKVGLLFHCMMSHPSVVYRRSFLQASGLAYRADYFPAEDYKMWADAVQRTTIINLEAPLVRYRQHGGQICRERHDEQVALEDRIRAELLHCISPALADAEVEFHNRRFASLCPQSEAELRLFARWARRLVRLNRRSRFVRPAVMRREMHRYLQNALRTYYAAHTRSRLALVGSSAVWRLDARHLLSLLIHGLGKKTA